MAWNGEAAKGRIKTELAKRMLAAAVIVQTEHMADLSKSFPPASKVGEFPHGRTWNLQTSVDYEPKTVEEVIAQREVRVGYQRRAWYILALVKRGRKSIVDTLERVRSRVVAMLGGSGRADASHG